MLDDSGSIWRRPRRACDPPLRRRDAPPDPGLTALPADVLLRVAERLTARDEYALARASKGLHIVLAARTAGLSALGAAERAARPALSRARIAAALAMADEVEATPPVVAGVVEMGALAGTVLLDLGVACLLTVCAPLTVGCAMWAEWRRTGGWRVPVAGAAGGGMPGDALIGAADRLLEWALRARNERATVISGTSRATRLGIALATVGDGSMETPHPIVQLRALVWQAPAALPSPSEVDAALAAALFEGLCRDDVGVSLRCLTAGARPDSALPSGSTPMWAARRLPRPCILHLLQSVASPTLHRLLGGSPGPLQRRLVREWVAAGGMPLYADSWGIYPRERALVLGDADVLGVLDAAARIALTEAISLDDPEFALRVLVAGTPWPAHGPGSLRASYDAAAETSAVRDILGAWQRRDADAAAPQALDDMCALYNLSTPSHRICGG